MIKEKCGNIVTGKIMDIKSNSKKAKSDKKKGSRIYLDGNLFVEMESIDKSDLISIMKLEHGRYLAKLFHKEWEIITRQELINKFEREHGKSLAMIIEKELQKLTLEELNKELMSAAIIYENERQELINRWEKEHGNDLALIIEKESQKIQLQELNRKLTTATIIHERDMKMAETVQRSMLFDKPPKTVNFDVAFHYQPLVAVSGDFYDFYINKNNKLTGLVLADVSGHGIASSLITILAKQIFFNAFQQYSRRPLSKVLEKINEQIIEQMEASNHYITAAILRFKDNNVEYANAAHHEIIVKDYKLKSSTVVRFKNRSVQGGVLGLSTVTIPFKSLEFEINSGDIILIFSDCLKESPDRDGEEFGQDRILASLDKFSQGYSAQEVLNTLMTDFNNHVEGVPIEDDLTVIVVVKK